MKLAQRYRVLRQVGEGGGGGVYLVEDRLSSGAIMALKRLHATPQTGVAQWLVNEFQILAQLDMPTVARVFDFGIAEADAEDPGGPFFTREFVDGAPLDAAVREAMKGEGSAGVLHAWFVSAAETLRELHRLGVVHGDLKPANMIVPRGAERVVLIDFGLAHGALGGADRIRGGTLAFMPPERQAQLVAGESLPSDPRADLYALCASVLAAMGYDSVDVARASQPPVDPAALRIRSVALAGVSVDPERRYATAEDFIAALTGVPPPARRNARVAVRPEGRESELGALLEHVNRRLLRREGGCSAVWLLGDEGSGRSTLLRETTWRAQLRGVQVLALAGASDEVPLRTLRDALGVLSGAPVDGSHDEALSRSIRAASAHAPVLLVVDDFDRVDPLVRASVRSIALAAETTEPVLLIAAMRDRAAIAEGIEGAAEVALAPLDEEAVANLCAQSLGAVEPSLVRAVHRRSAGAPMAVLEILQQAASRGAVTAADVDAMELPRRALDYAQRRLASLEPEERTALAAVAAIGGSAQPSALRALVGQQRLDALRTRGMLLAHPDGRLEVRSEALAQAALDAIDSVHRRDLLRGAAELLESSGQCTASTLAAAWVRAGDATRAERHVDTAIAELCSAGLPIVAGRMLGSLRAIAKGSVEPARVLQEAQLFTDAGATGEALEVALRVVDGGESEFVQRARLLVGQLRLKRGDADGARGILTDALARSTGGDFAGQLLCELAHVDFRAGLYAESVRRAEEGLNSATMTATRAALLARWGLATSYLGDQKRAIDLLSQSLAQYATLGAARDEARVLAYMAIAQDRAGDLGQARVLYERTLERSRAAGDLAAMTSARLNLGTLLDRSGDLAAALEHFAAAARLAQRAGDANGLLAARINTAGCLIRLGSYPRARTELDAVIARATTLENRELVASATGMLGVVRARSGETEAGLRLIDNAAALFGAIQVADGVADAELDAAEVLLDRGGPDDVARAGQRVAKARASLGDGADSSARATLVEGRLALARGDAQSAQRLLGEAISRADAAHDSDVLVRALSARSRAHRSMGAEIHARRDRERALEALEATAAILPPDLRSAFWSVADRVALRSEPMDPGTSPGPLPSAASGLAPQFYGNAPTVIADDQRLMLLLELSRRLGEEHSLDRVLDQAVRSAVDLTNAERGAILLIGPDGVLSMRGRSGPGPDAGPDEQFSRSIADTVLIDGEAVVTHNARSDTRFADYRSVHELAITAVAAVPIRTRGRTLGVLYVENRRRKTVWSPADVALMRAFAEQAGTAVEHAGLVEELEARRKDLERAKREIEELLAVRTEELVTTKLSLERANEALKSRFAPQGMVAQSESMRKVFAIIDRVRDSDVPVVVEGESGTGKELVARAIHFAGSRGKQPFIVVNCGAIPEPLLESELFGHVRGAFTGAERERRGLIASATGGTLMLDEVAEMPLKMQVELLRVLQDHVVRPVGGDRDEPVNVRIVAAANRPLRDLVREGRFREDLYYRLSVVTIALPPLRARPEDIPALATHFLAQFAKAQGARPRRLSTDALQRLMRQAWPGNVRQLRHVLESAAVLSDGDVIAADQLDLDVAPSNPTPPSEAPASAGSASPLALRKSAERQRILDALEQVNWNKVKAATVLGMPRRTLYRRLREYGLLDE